MCTLFYLSAYSMENNWFLCEFSFWNLYFSESEEKLGASFFLQTDLMVKFFLSLKSVHSFTIKVQHELEKCVSLYLYLPVSWHEPIKKITFGISFFRGSEEKLGFPLFHKLTC